MKIKSLIYRTIITVLIANYAAFCGWTRDGKRIVDDSTTLQNNINDELTNNINLSANFDTIKAMNDINKGHSLANAGNVMFFGGTILQLMGLNSHSGIVLIAGSVLQLSGPFLSYKGGDITRRGIRLAYPNYANHTGWSDFLISSSLVIVDIGFIIASSNKYEISNSMGAINIGISISAAVFFIKSVINPLLYSNKAKSKFLKEKYLIKNNMKEQSGT